MRRVVYVAVLVAALVGGVSLGALFAQAHPPTVPAAAVSSASPSPSAGPASGSPGVSPSASASPEASPEPSPSPTPVLVPAPLTGVLVSPDLAKRHPIAVMIDDQADARPQSGFTNASIVWQAPAEGGIPRYMAIYAEGTPPSVGPVRSSRYYFIAWAAEWRALYVHVGGSPQALSTLKSKGSGQYVYNADEFKYGGGAGYLWRIKTRFPPHNVYTDGTHLLALAKKVKATAAPTAIWTFAPDAPLDQRPVGGTIAVPYLANKISYAYDRASNRYLRSVQGKAQVDAATKQRVAPANVVVMWMAFAPLNDKKHRLEAQLTGSGKAWIFSNGQTVKGTWKKASITGPTRFYDAKGKQVTLVIGQTFVQVVQTGTVVKVVAGTAPPPATSPSPVPSTSPAASPTPSPS